MTPELQSIDGGPAFPHPDETVRGQKGMSLRAWLAGQESLSDFDSVEDSSISTTLSEQLTNEKQPEGGWPKNPLAMAIFEAKWRAALKLIRADAVIAELTKPKSDAAQR